jgi:hypothetical protein
MVGYWATPERPSRRTKVHVVTRNGKPLCGCRISEDSEYQWCSRRIVLEYTIECKRCLLKLLRMRQAEECVSAMQALAKARGEE